MSATINNGWVYKDRITMEHHGEYIKSFLTKKYRHSTYNEWGNRISNGEISINNQTIYNDQVIYSGDKIKWNRQPWEEPSVPKEWEILFDNGDILVINKPSGLPVMPGGGFLENTLCMLLKHKSIESNEKLYPKPIHRLGRFTSGVLLCARRRKSRAELSEQIRSQRNQYSKVRRIYRGLAYKNKNLNVNECISIDHPITKQKHQKLGYIWTWQEESIAIPDLSNRKLALPAKSEIRLLENKNLADLLEIVIYTGRPHQIRIHLASIGTPLIGDPLYKINRKISNIATPGAGGYQLHCNRIENILINHQKFSFESHPPRNLTEELNQDQL